MNQDQGVFSRLRIGSPCEVPGIERGGEGAVRFCAHCQQRVFDFAQLTPREARAQLAASGGRLCARLTHQGSHLVLKPEPRLAAPPATASWLRAPAAALVTAALSFTSPSLGAEQPAATTMGPKEPAPEPAAEDPQQEGAIAASAHLSGRLLDEQEGGVPGALMVARHLGLGTELEAISNAEGVFSFGQIEPGLYLVEGHIEGFDIEATATTSVKPGETRQLELKAKIEVTTIIEGAMVVVSDPMRVVFEGSNLVAVATVGQSRVVERDSSSAKIATELRLKQVIRGPATPRTVVYEWEQGLSADSPEPRLEELQPGTQVLALLKRAETTGSGKPPS